MGTTAVVGVPDKWSFSLNATNRLVLDGLSGLGNSWTLRDANGTAVRSGNLGGVGVMVLAAGAYTLEVQANGTAALGTYSLRLLDVGAAQALSLDQANTANSRSGFGRTSAGGAIDWIDTRRHQRSPGAGQAPAALIGALTLIRPPMAILTSRTFCPGLVTGRQTRIFASNRSLPS